MTTPGGTGPRIMTIGAAVGALISRRWPRIPRLAGRARPGRAADEGGEVAGCPPPDPTAEQIARLVAASPQADPFPVRGGTPAPSRAGHIPCVVCTHTIRLDEYRQARCWTDPQGVTCAAHAACLVRVGETDLRLPPDPGEHHATHHHDGGP